MAEEDILRRWLGFELHKLNEAAVVRPVPLSELLRMRSPNAPTRSGGVHDFDPAALRAFAAQVPLHLHHRLRLPITVYEPHDTPGEGYVQEATAVEVLSAMGAAATSPRDGRLWFSLPLAKKLAERFPTLLQSMAL